MLIKLYAENTNERTLREVVRILQAGGVIAYPTDTVYAFGCSLGCPKAIERLKVLKGKDDQLMAIICSDLSNLADYAKVDNATFRILKRNIPGGFTFILPATGKAPDRVLTSRKAIGIRVPDNAIARAIVQALGSPLVTTSIHDTEVEYMTDPELIQERFTTLDAVVDGGYGDVIASTIVDFTQEETPVIIRQGAAVLN